MLKRSRVTGALDIGRLGQALARPGMDTRTWVSMAIIEKVKVDKKHGIICDITLMPSGQSETAHAGAAYAGNGWGEYRPLYQDDLVIVEAPNGDPNAGMVIVARLHSPSDPPPQDAIDHQDDPSITAKPGKNIRNRTSTGGKWIANSENVRLGDENATEQYMLGTTYRTNETTWHNGALMPLLFGISAFGIAATVFGAAVATFATAAGTGFTAASHATGLSPTDQGNLNAAAGAATVFGTAGTALGVAGGFLTALATSASSGLTTFESQALRYLSTVTKSK